MFKLLIPFLLVAAAVTACNSEPEFPLQQVDFDVATFNRERAAWLEQGMGAYSYEFVYGSLATGLRYIHARVTVEDNAITDIEDLGPAEEWKDDLYNDHMESIIRLYGGVTAIYTHISDWYAAESKKLGDKEQLRCEMRYNAQHRYPEYVNYGVSTYRYAGNNTWIAAAGSGTTLKLSNFQITDN
jgi:hypothetical protein